MVAPEAAAAADMVAGAVVCLPTVSTRVENKEIKGQQVGKGMGERVREEWRQREKEKEKAEGKTEGERKETKEAEQD